ncbi:MAG: adenylate/guanylate cyclase domain-containing protein [Ignavibacteria bacterium]|nr:adenylate/guanylate cyclase domain-containing protein [Ignavibacteria bacterium]
MGENGNNILSESDVSTLRKINSQRRNGFLVLLDIKDSTIRKIHYSEKWATQTGILYSAFRRFFESFAEKMGAEQAIIKFIGDGLLVFYPGTIGKEKFKNQECDPQLAQFLIDNTLEFINAIHEEDEFCGLKLKSVIAYLTGIQLIDTGASGAKDVLGRGIDFAFRLEKFADTTHIVLNEMIANAIKRTQKISESQQKFELISCRRKMRGWDDAKGEVFYLLTGKQMIADNITAIIPSIYSENVTNELFSFFVKKRPSTNAFSSVDQLIQKALENLENGFSKGASDEH